VPQTARSRAFISSAASRYAPAGLYIYFELPRPDGAVAHVELDLPAGRGVGGPPGGPFLSYREFVDRRPVFRSQTASGRVEVPVGDCPCRDGRLELLFTDPGPDGKLGSEDDLHRRLSRGRFAWNEDHFCRSAKLLDLSDGSVIVDAPNDCPTVSHGSSGGGSSGGGSVAYEGGGGCYAEDDYYYEEDSGCGYDDGSDSYGEEYDDTGCDGDRSDSEYSDDSGCDGDTSGDSYDYDSTGCEGDTSSSSASCEGDAYAAAPGDPRSRRGRGATSKLTGMMLPFALLGLFWGYLRRH
jgi:hypothetical protein